MFNQNNTNNQQQKLTLSKFMQQQQQVLTSQNMFHPRSQILQYSSCYNSNNSSSSSKQHQQQQPLEIPNFVITESHRLQQQQLLLDSSNKNSDDDDEEEDKEEFILEEENDEEEVKFDVFLQQNITISSHNKSSKQQTSNLPFSCHDDVPDHVVDILSKDNSALVWNKKITSSSAAIGLQKERINILGSYYHQNQQQSQQDNNNYKNKERFFNLHDYIQSVCFEDVVANDQDQYEDQFRTTTTTTTTTLLTTSFNFIANWKNRQQLEQEIHQRNQKENKIQKQAIQNQQQQQQQQQDDNQLLMMNTTVPHIVSTTNNNDENTSFATLFQNNNIKSYSADSNNNNNRRRTRNSNNNTTRQPQQQQQTEKESKIESIKFDFGNEEEEVNSDDIVVVENEESARAKKVAAFQNAIATAIRTHTGNSTTCVATFGYLEKYLYQLRKHHLLPSNNNNNNSRFGNSSSSASSLNLLQLQREFKNFQQADPSASFINKKEEVRRIKEKKIAGAFERSWKVREQALAQRRLVALRSNNPEEYVRHLQSAKWSSLLQIMEKTHSLMLKIGVQLDKKTTTKNVEQNEEASSSCGQKQKDNNNKEASSSTTAVVAGNTEENNNNNNNDSSDAFRKFQAYVRSTSDEYNLVHKNAVFVAEQPKAVLATLMPHQIDGLRFLASLHGNGINGANLDEMGCGKTLQTLSFFAYLKETNQVKGMHLVLAPLSIIREWVESIATFVPSLRVRHINSEADFYSVPQYKTGNNNNNVDVCLLALHRVRFFPVPSSHQKTSNSGCLLFSHKWHYVVVDEAHKAVSNPNTATAIAIQRIPFHNRLVLTGTPLNSDVQELWSLLQFLNPDVFCSGDETELTFDEVFRKPFASLVAPPPKKKKGNSNKAADVVSKETVQSEAAALRLEPEERDLVVMRLHQILKPFVIRRTKLDVDASLRITFHTIWCPLSALQVKLLNLLRGTDDDENENDTNKNKEDEEQQQQQVTLYKKPARILPAILRDGSLQYQRGNSVAANALSICNHPFMCDFLPQLMRRKKIPEREEEEILLRSSGKLCILDALLVHLRHQRRQAVVFSHYLDTIDILENHFIGRGWGKMFVSLTGAASPEERAAGVRRFREHPDECFIFLLSMKAGGCGLNLQSADTVILYDRDYTATNEDQAISRVFRMGQLNVVRAIYLMTKDETENRVAAIAENKDKPRKEIIDGGAYLIEDDVDKNEEEEQEQENFSNSSSSSSQKRQQKRVRDDDDDELVSVDEEQEDEESTACLEDKNNNNENKNSNKKKSLRESHKVQEIHCETASQMQQNLIEHVFKGFLKRAVPREENEEDEELEDRKQQQQHQSDEKQEMIPVKEDDVAYNNNVVIEKEKDEEEQVKSIFDLEDQNQNYQLLLQNQQQQQSSSSSSSRQPEKNDDNSQQSSSKHENTSTTSPTQQHQHQEEKEEEVVPFFSSFPSTEIFLPYSSFSNLHPVILNAFIECEKHERLEFEGNDQLGIGCRRRKTNQQKKQKGFGGDDDDDDEDDNLLCSDDDDDDDFDLMFLDLEPDLEAVEKIMDEEDLSDEEEALELWRERLVEKEKFKKKAKLEAKKLQEQFGAGIEFDNSYSSFVESNQDRINNLTKNQLKNLKEKFKLKQFTLKTRTQYRSDFLNELKDSFSKKYKTFF